MTCDVACDVTRDVTQVMLFRLRHHQSYAVVFSFLSTVYSLYEYAAGGIPYT